MSAKQNAFVREYLKDYCGYKAALRAGYAPGAADVQACRLLSLDKIQEAVKREERKLQNRFYQSKERILKELALIGFADPEEYYEVDDDGKVTINNLSKLPPQISRAIKSVKNKVKSLRREDGDEIIENQLEFTLHDKLQALQLMGKELGMFKEKLVVGGPDDGPINVYAMSDEELLRVIQRDRGKGDAKAHKGKK